ncbi:uncharacterized protein LOC130788197 [Actinidia eriantha]|uniref:uncharacterized protein LOC130788197 n=1 Tax=Actinidia eriantha TaxID=165200 RepID=UPI002589CAE2|nr:uncharacterized protein LOC130788197 [Actinidia eriantha]
MFKDSLNLHNYVKKALAKQVTWIVDPILIAGGGESAREVAAVGEEENADNDEIEVEENDGETGIDLVQKCIVSVLKIGPACSEKSPRERMVMKDVPKELYHIRGGFLGRAPNRDRPRINQHRER